MYHPGKVVEVFRPSDKDVISSDGTVQATMRMWDENLLTMLVAPKIAKEIKPGQVVLVDYRPDEAHRPPVPTHVIVKILTGRKADEIWKTYKEVYDKQKRAAAEKQQPQQSYIG